jgi:hypothetical protein
MDFLELGKKDFRGMCFTLCNTQKGDNRIYCKLDRPYVNKYNFRFVPNDDVLKVYLYPCTISYHHPIKSRIHMNLGRTQTIWRKDGLILDTHLLKDSSLKDVITSIKEINRWMLKSANATKRWNQNVEA